MQIDSRQPIHIAALLGHVELIRYFASLPTVDLKAETAEVKFCHTQC